MNRRRFFTFAFAREQASIDEQRRVALEFDRHWDPYLRRLFGCPLTGETTAETCRTAFGETAYRDFSRAREIAKTLFALREP